MRRTSHKGTAIVTTAMCIHATGVRSDAPVTYTMIRAHVDGFTGFSPRGNTMQIGKVWSMVGPTVREAMVNAEVVKFMIYGAQAVFSVKFMADDSAQAMFSVENIRDIRRAMFEECEAQGIWVHEGESFIA